MLLHSHKMGNARATIGVIGSHEKPKKKVAWYSQKPMISHAEVHRRLYRPFIVRGYRPSHQPISYYVASVFHPTNETLQFWTHFLPLVHFVYKYFHLYSSHVGPLETFTYPFFAHGIACCILLFASCVAHMFCSHSEVTCHACFSFDVATIYVFSFSLRGGFESYLCPMAHYWDWPLSEMTLTMFGVYWVLSSWLSLASSTINHTLGRVCNTVSHLIGGLVGFSPCIIRYIFGAQSQPDHLSHFIGHDVTGYILFACGAFGLACFIYSLRIPERFFPGVFDIVGNSHQLMHVLGATSLYAQSWALQDSMELTRMKMAIGEIPESAVSHFTLRDTVGWVLLVALLTNVAIVVHWKAVGPSVGEKRKKVE